MKNNKFWIVAIAVLFIVCAALSVYIFTSAEKGNIAVVIQDGVEFCRLDLSEDTEMSVISNDGGYNIIVVENGTVKVFEADCPDQICVKQGAIDSNAAPIVCLPHKLVIEVTAESNVDAVAK